VPEALDNAALLQRIDSATAMGADCSPSLAVWGLPWLRAFLPNADCLFFGRWQPRQGDQVSATPLWLRHPRGPLINDLIDRREAAKTDA
jgi:hypothetical protein